jgi:serine/threonine protein phosphatase 1
MKANHCNPPRRLLAIGDIHGCRAQLEQLLEQVAPGSDDRVVFLGDYIDRGPDSAGTIDLLLAFGRRFPESVFLRGNHEQMLADYLAGRERLIFLSNGGLKTLQSYREDGRWPLPPEHQEFFAALRPCYESEHYIFVHAGLRPGVPLATQSEDDLLWIRHEFIDSDFDWGKTVVYGHTPLKEPLLSARRIGLDTGCVYGRKLTCCDVLNRTIWQVDGKLD